MTVSSGVIPLVCGRESREMLEGINAEHLGLRSFRSFERDTCRRTVASIAADPGE